MAKDKLTEKERLLVWNDLVYDFSLMHANFYDMTIVPIMGGIISNQYVELGEDQVDDEIKANQEGKPINT